MLNGGNVAFTSAPLSLLGSPTFDNFFPGTGPILTLSGGFNTNGLSNTVAFNTGTNPVTMSGGLTGNGGTLILGGNGGTLAAATSIINNGFTGGNSVNLEVNGPIIDFKGGAAGYTGNTIVAGGFYEIGNGAALTGSSGLIMAGGTIGSDSGTGRTVNIPLTISASSTFSSASTGPTTFTNPQPVTANNITLSFTALATTFSSAPFIVNGSGFGIATTGAGGVVFANAFDLNANSLTISSGGSNHVAFGSNFVVGASNTAILVSGGVGTTLGSVFDDSSASASGLTITNTGTATVGIGSLLMGSNDIGATASGGVISIGSGITYTGSRTFTLSGQAGVTFVGTDTPSGATPSLIFVSSNAAIMTWGLTTPGAPVIFNGPTVLAGAANTYTTATTLAGGILELQAVPSAAGGPLGTSLAPLTLSGGSLRSSAGGSKILGMPVTVNGNVTMAPSTANGQTITFSGTVTTAPGGAMTFNNPTSFSGGSVILGADFGVAGSSTGTFLSGLTLSPATGTNVTITNTNINTSVGTGGIDIRGAFNTTDTLTFAGTGISVFGDSTAADSVTGVLGGVFVAGSTVVFGSSASTFLGGVTLNSGQLDFDAVGVAGASGPLGKGAFTINGGTLDNATGASIAALFLYTPTINGNFTFCFYGGTQDDGHRPQLRRKLRHHARLRRRLGAHHHHQPRHLDARRSHRQRRLDRDLHRQGRRRRPLAHGCQYLLGRRHDQPGHPQGQRSRRTRNQHQSHPRRQRRCSLVRERPVPHERAFPVAISGTGNGVGALVNSAAAIGTFPGAITLNGSGAIGNTSGSALTVTGTITGTGGNLTINPDNSGAISLQGGINIVGTIFDSGSGSGTVTYSGTLGSGVLGITQNDVAGLLSLAGGLTSSTNNFTLSGPGPITQTSTAVVLGQLGNLVLNGPGTVTLGAKNTFSGGLTVNGGAIATANIGNAVGAAQPFGTGLLNLNGILQFNTTGTFAGLFTVPANGNATVYANGNGGALTLNNSGAIVFAGGSASTLTLGAFNSADLMEPSDQYSLPWLQGRRRSPDAPATSVSQIGVGIWKLANAGNSYTGATTIAGGILTTASLADGGTNSNIGASTSAASNLILSNDGALQYTGAQQSTNRLLTLGAGGGMIDASGTGALTFSNLGNIAFAASNATPLVLTGSSTANNTFDPSIGDAPGGKTSLIKNGIGTWILAGTNTYSGGTTVNQGVLEFNSPSAEGTAPVGGSNANITLNSLATNNAAGTAPVIGSTVAYNYAFSQSDLNHITTSSVGTAALAGGLSDSNDLNFSSFAGLSLGAIGTTPATYAGTLTPSGSTYLLGGGGGTLSFNSPIASGSLVVGLPGGQGSGGTVVLGGPNTFSGGITINSGNTLAGNASSTTPFGSSGNAVTINNGTLTLNADPTNSDSQSIGTLTSNGGQSVVKINSASTGSVNTTLKTSVLSPPALPNDVKSAAGNGVPTKHRSLERSPLLLQLRIVHLAQSIRLRLYRHLADRDQRHALALPDRTIVRHFQRRGGLPFAVRIARRKHAYAADLHDPADHRRIQHDALCRNRRERHAHGQHIGRIAQDRNGDDGKSSPWNHGVGHDRRQRLDDRRRHEPRRRDPDQRQHARRADHSGEQHRLLRQWVRQSRQQHRDEQSSGGDHRGDAARSRHLRAVPFWSRQHLHRSNGDRVDRHFPWPAIHARNRDAVRHRTLLADGKRHSPGRSEHRDGLHDLLRQPRIRSGRRNHHARRHGQRFRDLRLDHRLRQQSDHHRHRQRGQFGGPQQQLRRQYDHHNSDRLSQVAGGQYLR